MVRLLICAGNLNEFISVRRRLGLDFDECKYVQSQYDLNGYSTDTPVFFYGTYYKRNDYLQIAEQCKMRGLQTFSLQG